MKDILFFDSMLTPKIITVVYWLMLIGVVLAGFGAWMGQQGFVVSVGIWVGGAIGVRIWCEMLIVLFKINDNLKKLADKA